MEEFIKTVEHILYMENFGMAITDELKVKFLGLYGSYVKGVPEKYSRDVQRLKTKFS